MFRGPLIELFMLLFSVSVTESQVVSVVLSVFSVLVIIFVVFPIHECAHGLMAKILGDDTAERQGRLTLNPFAHIDVMGAVMMMLFRIGWAKPTPVDIRRCNKVSYIMIIAYKLVLMNLTSTTGAYIALGLYYTAQINVYLAVFNLVPIAPFDGFNILASFLPGKAVYFMQKNQQIIYWVFFALLMFGVLSVPFGLACNGIMWLLDKASFFLG